ncbi:MAG: DUF3332 domain-containing protein [Bacteroidaceae bacterium]|nr:DUF3332 domain-containing protein [Bacteroidaceae bacterium]
MKKISFKVAALLLSATLVCTSCIGSFALFNGYEKWQCNMTSSKIVNGLVGLILQPIVGSVCLFVDAIVLNTIEFWTGDNPVASTGTQSVTGSDGRNYLVKATKKGYEVKAEDGVVTYFNHDSKTDSWSITQNGVTRELVRFNADGTVSAILPSGAQMTVSRDLAGVQQVRQAVWSETCFAQR